MNRQDAKCAKIALVLTLLRGNAYEPSKQLIRMLVMEDQKICIPTEDCGNEKLRVSVLSDYTISLGHPPYA